MKKGTAPDTRTWQILELLADGEFHSGEHLAERIGVSRASIFNTLSGVGDYGISLQRIRGRGYRLARPWRRLDHREIKRGLGDQAGQFCLEILPHAESSNALLLQRAISSDLPSASVLAVELQTSGRGRLGRVWHSGIGNALTFSLLWRFGCGLNGLSGLSLAVGVAVARALKKAGAQGVQLKWPNDILAGQGKMGGVLIEAQGDMLGPSAVVIGIGLNCTLPDHLAGRIGQPASALDEVCNVMPDRNRLLAALLQELAHVLHEFARHGFSPFRDEWMRYHAYHGQPVGLHMPDGSTVSGIACGIGEGGELCLETAQGMRHFNSGEVLGQVKRKAGDEAAD